MQYEYDTRVSKSQLFYISMNIFIYTFSLHHDNVHNKRKR